MSRVVETQKVAVMVQMRTEQDILGKRELPADALYGINTARALENFPLTGRTIAALPEFVPALAILKEAAALANLEIGALSAQKAEAIVEACQEIRAGRYDAHLRRARRLGWGILEHESQ